MTIYQIKSDKCSANGLFASRDLIKPSLELWYGPDFKVSDCDGLFLVHKTTDSADYRVFTVIELIVRDSVQTY